MRPPPRTHVFLYMFSKGARKYQEISGRNRKKQEETGNIRTTKIPSHQMNDSWGFNLFKI